MAIDFEAELREVAPRNAGNEFTLAQKPHPIHVTFSTDTDTGSTTWVRLWARYDDVAFAAGTGYRGPAAIVAVRPMAIVLRRETADDRAAKESALSAEWQSGDPEFDRTFYVATPTAASVLVHVLGAEVREAALELVRLGLEHVSIDVDGTVEVALPAISFGHPEPRRDLVLAAFARLLSHLPAVRASGGAHPPRPLARLTIGLFVIAALGLVLNVGYSEMIKATVLALRGRPIASVGWPFILALAAGAVGGIVGARLYGNVVARRARGRADAHDCVGQATLAAFAACAVVAFTLGFVVALVAFD